MNYKINLCSQLAGEEKEIRAKERKKQQFLFNPFFLVLKCLWQRESERLSKSGKDVILAEKQREQTGEKDKEARFGLRPAVTGN